MKQRLSTSVQMDMNCEFETSGAIKLVPHSWNASQEVFEAQSRYRATVSVQENGHKKKRATFT